MLSTASHDISSLCSIALSTSTDFYYFIYPSSLEESTLDLEIHSLPVFTMDQGSAGGSFVSFLLFIALYAYFAVAIQTMAKKTGTKND